MAVSYSGFAIKHTCSLPEDLAIHIKRGGYLTNKTYYLVPIEKTFHYNALCGDFDIYNKYIKAAKDEKSHSESKFRELIQSFDLAKLDKIRVNMYGHTPKFWVQDGNHRLVILKHKGLFPRGVPIEYLSIDVYPDAQEILKNALRKTVNRTHYNGWNNRLEFGYHSFDIYNIHIQGQRNPKQRFEKIKKFYDFTDKNVLDLGCNTGGMLFHISEIKKGVGLDFDDTCIDSCNIFKTWLNLAPEYKFHKQDLNAFDCATFCKEHNFKPDIIFLLSLGSWVKEWRKLYTDCYNSSKAILLETNNDTEGAPQLELFKQLGSKITLISSISDDDCTGNHGRKTYLIERSELTERKVKLVHYLDNCHPNNKRAMMRMCTAAGIEYELTNDRQRLKRPDYEYAWIPMGWISPDEFPRHVKILYGPHFSIFPEGPLIGPRNPEWSKRAVYNVLADWNLAVFSEFAKETVIPLAALPFGINPAIEDVRTHPKTLDCILYFKDRAPAQLEFTKALLDKKNLKYRIFKYGSYSNDDYMKTLKTVKFVLWLGRHESQGFAFQDCLASNVPILLWDATTMTDEWNSYKEHKGHKHLYATAATQWSSECGEKILREYELESALDYMVGHYDKYTPRKFILERVSDKITMDNVLKCLNTAECLT
jgi:SAM-dependent methyltransferase